MPPSWCQEYRDYLIGLVSDVEFPLGRQTEPGSWFRTGATDEGSGAGCSRSLTNQPHRVPSPRPGGRIFVSAQTFSHSAERSSRILTEHVGFGDFVFRLPDLSEVGRAKDLNELEEQLQTARRKASPTTPRATTFPIGSWREPNSLWPPSCGPASLRLFRTGNTCAAT